MKKKTVATLIELNKTHLWGGFKPFDYEYGHENFLLYTIESLHIDFSDNCNIVV